MGSWMSKYLESTVREVVLKIYLIKYDHVYPEPYE